VTKPPELPNNVKLRKKKLIISFAAIFAAFLLFSLGALAFAAFNSARQSGYEEQALTQTGNLITNFDLQVKRLEMQMNETTERVAEQLSLMVNLSNSEMQRRYNDLERKYDDLEGKYNDLNFTTGVTLGSVQLKLNSVQQKLDSAQQDINSTRFLFNQTTSSLDSRSLMLERNYDSLNASTTSSLDSIRSSLQSVNLYSGCHTDTARCTIGENSGISAYSYSCQTPNLPQNMTVSSLNCLAKATHAKFAVYHQICMREGEVNIIIISIIAMIDFRGYFSCHFCLVSMETTSSKFREVTINSKFCLSDGVYYYFRNSGLLHCGHTL
jgi:hypothetical protein